MRKLSLIILLFILAGCGRSDKLEHGSGVFETDDITVSAKSSGEIVEFNIEEGMILKAGYIAGYLDSSQLILKKEQLVNAVITARSKLIDVDKQIAPYNEEIKKYKKEVERFKRLVKSDAVNKKQLEDMEFALSSALKKKEAVEDNFKQTNNVILNQIEDLKIQIKQIDDSISKTVINVSDNGTVLVKYVEKGEFVQAGRPLFKMADVSRITLRAYVTADILTQVKLGSSATVYADFGREGFKQYNGKVTWISDRAEFTPKTVPSRDERSNLVYGVKIVVNNDGFIKKGMYGQVRFDNIGLNDK